MKRKVLLPPAAMGAGAESWGCTRRSLFLRGGEMALFSKRGTMKCFKAERLSSHESQASRGLQLPHEGQL